MSRAGKPWSRLRSSPLTRSASSASGSVTCPAVEHRPGERALLDRGERPPTPAPARRPARPGRAAARRSRSARVDQPSTQAIGSRAVCCGEAEQLGAGEGARRRPGERQPPRRPGGGGRDPGGRRGPVDREAVAALARSPGRGAAAAPARAAGRRSVWPAVSAATNSTPPPTSASAPRRLIVGGAGIVGDQPGGLGRGLLGPGLGQRGAQLRAQRPGPQAAQHVRQLEHHVRDERGE